MEEAAARYSDKVEVKTYYAGKDFDYIRKYGVILKGTMIINGEKKYDAISKNIIEKAIEEAVKEIS